MIFRERGGVSMAEGERGGAMRKNKFQIIFLAGFCVLLNFALLSGKVAQKPSAGSPSIQAVLTGDYADPTIVRVGGDYYMTHSSYTYMPGLLIWHSKDLKRWDRVCHALHTFVGDVWAPDFVHYKDKFYIYFPAARTNWVVTADRPEGPWSEPVDLHLRGIDPGHIATPDGKRYLYVDSGRVVELAPDGLSMVGEPTRVYNGWPYPEDWVVEGFYSESPKLIYKEGYYYLTTAQGGTAGPSTSHMIVSARSKSPLGPWQNSPFNPVVHTWSRAEKYWSKGHGTIFADAAGQWNIIYHGYENGYAPLGRNTLIEPIEWTKDGWFKTVRDPKTEGSRRRFKNVIIESDDFSRPDLKLQWQFSGSGAFESHALKDGELKLTASPDDYRVLHSTVGDHSYEASVKLGLEGEVEAGLVAYYNNKFFAGVGIKGGVVFGYAKGASPFGPTMKAPAVKFLKIRMVEFDLQFFHSEDGKAWTPCPNSLEVSGYHQNMLGGFSSLKVGILARGKGTVTIDDFIYRAQDCR
jgi:xylan 1,4-beta-xylosidase